MKALYRQSLIDIAVANRGNADDAIDIAIANNMSLTDNIDINVDLSIDNKSNKITNFFKLNSMPATAITDIVATGIDFMGIEVDFIVA